MIFSEKRNPLMRQPLKRSKNITTVQDTAKIINTFNNKLDKLNNTMIEIRDLLSNGIQYNNISTINNTQNQKINNKQKEDFYVPEPDISSIKSSNKERDKQTIDSQSISDTLDSLNDINK